MKAIQKITVRGLTLLLAFTLASFALQANAEHHEKYKAQFTKDGKLVRPEGWREWIFIGSPVTPNSLNAGAAPFPEFHSVYIDPKSWAHWKETGLFREGTMIAKELSSVGDTSATSGVGFFNGENQGFEIAYKNTKMFKAEPGGWVYFTYGHHAEPYADAVAPMPTAACAACHQAAAKDDMVFTQYYPILRGAKKMGAKGAGMGGNP